MARIHRRTVQKRSSWPRYHDGVIIHLKPGILECEIKWALESITTNKARAGNGIAVELFQILKDDAVKVMHSICQQIWKTQQWPRDWKKSVLTSIPKKGNAKECSNYHTTALISHASNAQNSPSHASAIHEPSRCSSWFQKRQRNQRSNCQHPINIYFCFIDYAKVFNCVDHNKLWKILKEMGIPDHLTCLLRNLYAGQEATVRTGHWTTDWFQIGKGVRLGCILSPCFFNFYADYIMRNAG